MTQQILYKMFPHTIPLVYTVETKMRSDVTCKWMQILTTAIMCSRSLCHWVTAWHTCITLFLVNDVSSWLLIHSQASSGTWSFDLSSILYNTNRGWEGTRPCAIRASTRRKAHQLTMYGARRAHSHCKMTGGKSKEQSNFSGKSIDLTKHQSIFH